MMTIMITITCLQCTKQHWVKIIRRLILDQRDLVNRKFDINGEFTGPVVYLVTEEWEDRIIALK